MAREKDDNTGLDESQRAFANQIAAGVAAGISDATGKYGPIRQIPITQYRSVTPTNPEGLPENQRPQLMRRYFQNGFDVAADKLTDEQRRLLNKLQPGQYLDGLVEIGMRNPGNGDAVIVDIRYNNASTDQRMEMKSRVRDFTDLLQQCIAEHDVLVGT